MPGSTDFLLKGGLDKSQLLRDIQTIADGLERTISTSTSRGMSQGIRASNVTQPLGRITASFREFDKSLEASNARVLAFGASAGIILGVQRAMANMVKSTIEVEKSLTDINVILGLNTKNLQKFGAELFDVAKNTGQSFKTVASAAIELSRQGLSVEQTLKRTRDAMILSRQSGLEITASVEAITAALNSFDKTLINSTQLINKLANVDAQFAVSSADLAEAIKRVGSTAQDAGVGLNELLGLVTAIQQRTARGGPVIGNALKSIFARISRPEAIEQLRELGVNISETQNGIEKLRALSDALKTATPATASIIKQMSGGVYQINIVSAALADLGSQYSIVKEATEASANATDEAIKRQQEYNKTLAALGNKTLTNLIQFGSQFGKIAVGPLLETTANTINLVMEGAISKSADNFGSILGKGMLTGLGSYLSGSGFILIGITLGKLAGRLAKDFSLATQAVLGLNQASQSQLVLEKSLTNFYAQNPKLIAEAASGTVGWNNVLKITTAELEKQSATLRASAETAQRMAGIIGKNIGVYTVKSKESPISGALLTGKPTGRGYTPLFAKAYDKIPNFASPLSNAISRERAAGIPSYAIRVGSHPQLVSPVNPAGLGVYNTKDEPLGLSQGIRRVISQGGNPKTAGMPNFARENLFGSTFGVSESGQVGNIDLANLNLGINKFRNQISLGQRSIEEINKNITELSKEYSLTSQAQRKLRLSYETLYKQFISSQPKLGSSRANEPLTGQLLLGLGGQQFGFSGSGKQGEFISIVQQAQLASFQKQMAGLTTQFQASVLNKFTDQFAKRIDYIFKNQQQRIINSITSSGGPLQSGRLSEALQTRQIQRAIGNPDLLKGELSKRGLPNASGSANQLATLLLSILPPSIRNQLSFPKATDTGSLAGPSAPRYGVYGSEERAANIRARYQRRYGLDGQIRRGYDNFRENNLNKAFAFSILTPIVGGAIQEALGNETRGGRIAGAGVQGLANIGSFALTSTLLTKNPYAAAAITAGGAIVEVNKFIKVINDKTPDLEKAMQSYKESIDKNNENLQGVITGTEALRQIRGGETSATPYQYREILQRVRNQTAALSSTLPNNRGDISRAIERGDLSGLEEMVGRASRRSNIEIRGLELQKNAQQFKTTFGQRIKSAIFDSPMQASPYASLYEPERLRRAATPLPLQQQQDISSFVTSFLSQQNLEGENLYSLILKDYQRGPGNSISKLFTSATGAGNIDDIRKGLLGAVGQTQERFGLLPSQTKGFIDFINETDEKKLRETFKALESIGTAAQEEMKGILDIPKMLKAMAASASRFEELASSMDLFLGKLDLAAKERLDINSYQRSKSLIGLERSNIGSSLIAGRVSPLEALNIEFNQKFKELEANLKGDQETIIAKFAGQRRGKIGDFIGGSLKTVGEAFSGARGSALGTVYEKEAVKNIASIFGISGTTPVEKRSPFGFDPITGRDVGPEITIEKTKSFENIFSEIFAAGQGIEDPQKLTEFIDNFVKVRKDLQESLRKVEIDVSTPQGQGISKFLNLTEGIEKLQKLTPEEQRAELDSRARQYDLEQQKLKTDLLKQQQAIIREQAMSYNDYTRNLSRSVEYQKQENELRNQIYEQIRQGTLDEEDGLKQILDFQIKRRKESVEELVLQGKQTAEILRQITLQEKLEKIKRGSGLSGKDIGEVVSANLTYTQENQWNSILEMADGVTKTMKQGFKDAFVEFAMGAKSAEDAMRQLGLTIAREVLERVTSMAFDTLFSKIGGLGGFFNKKSSGGSIRGYAGGGMVYGGSGTRDDIPMMLNKGSYVIRKSSVGKYGVGALNAINGGGVSNFAVGGFSQILKNQYLLDNTKYPKSGKFDVDPRLSVIGQTDENNPQNEIKFAEEQGMLSYMGTRRQYKDALKQYKAGKTQSFIGGLLNAALLVGGAAIGSGATKSLGGGARITKTSSGYTFSDSSGYKSYGGANDPEFSALWYGRAGGGYSQDRIPAMLTGGEYVMSSSAVKRHGIGFMDQLNSGQIPISKYQTGGLVGRDSNLTPTMQDYSGGWKQITDALTKLIGVSEEIRDSKTSPQEKTKPDSVGTTNNSVTINISYTSGSDKATATSDGKSDNKNKDKDIKQLGEMMKNIALDTIITQQRPGGLLADTR